MTEWKPSDHFGAGAGRTVVMSLCPETHTRWWRFGEGHPWTCGTCHPPAFSGVEWRDE